jgi:hypothetical protein
MLNSITLRKLMKFKGINGKCPCRFCTMKAIPRKSGAQTTYYLARLLERHRLNPDYVRLPLRRHEQIVSMAKLIDETVDEEERDELQMNSGIVGQVG